ncbi:MAG: ornithine cyclodeaminase family protein [Pyrinomonadaceae bacterium]|nr:ornithine cyclodeaminase family protein [Pyrinomonadaceae bacterium]
MKIIPLEQIKEVLPSIDLVSEIEKGFVAYSQKRSVVPPVGELLLDKGEVHIKYGYIKEDDYYVIKIASGFYENSQLGLPSSNGLMLLFKQETGELAGVLLDEGYLTDVRTAIAGSIAAKYLAPKDITRIGIVGTGIQARLQLRYLKAVTDCKSVLVWGRGEEQIEGFRSDMEAEGFSVKGTTAASEVLLSCNLIVTTTPSKEPLLFAPGLQSGTHITAVGSDTPQKQELDPELLERADLIVADSISQCLERGEIYQAIRSEKISEEELVELGSVISGSANGRNSPEQITIADLTGVAVQDMMIARAVFSAVIAKVV